MRKIEKSEQKTILGGKAHYHWRCHVEMYISKSYSTRSAAQSGANNHLRLNGGYHKIDVYQCTGNCLW